MLGGGDNPRPATQRRSDPTEIVRRECAVVEDTRQMPDAWLVRDTRSHHIVTMK
jgi:hypothetical protein